MPQVLTTKEQVKIWLEDTVGTSSFDALLDEIVLAVSQRIELAANRKLFNTEYVELHDGGTPRIYVKNPPITKITKIVYAYNYDFANGFTLGTSEYVLDPTDHKNCIYSTFGAFLSGPDSLKVTYEGGYISADEVDTNIPPALRAAAALQAVYLFKNRKTIGFDNVEVGTGGIVHKITSNWLLPEVMDMVKQLRVRNIY